MDADLNGIAALLNSLIAIYPDIVLERVRGIEKCGRE
jgi:hypothetical protein